MRYYFGWNVVAISIAFQTVIFGTTFFAYTLWASQWRETFDAPRGDVMLGITILTLCQGVMAPLGGRAMDRMSIRGLICAGTVITAVGFLLISMAQALWQVLAVYGTLMALGTLLAGPLAAQTLAAKWFNRRRGLAIGLSTLGTSLGGFLLPPVVAWLFMNYGWRNSHLILAVAMVFLIVPAVWLVVRNNPGDRGIEPEAPPQSGGRPTAPTTFPEWTTLSLLRQRNFWVMIGAFIPMVTVFGALQHNMVQIAADSGVDAARASWLISCFSGTMLVGKIFFGALADRTDLRILYGLSISLLAGAAMIFMTTPPFYLLVAAAGILGLAAGGFLPLLGCIVSTRFGPHAFGRVMGLVGLFMLLAGLGPWFAGSLRDFAGDYDLVLQVFLVLLIPAVCAMLFLKPLPVPPRELAPGE